MIERIAWINGVVLLVLVLMLVLALLAYGWWFLAIAEPPETAYNPTTEGIPAVAKLRPLPCERPGCHGARSHRHLICPACWREVPKHLRNDVYRTWDDFQGRRENGYLHWITARRKCLESLAPITSPQAAAVLDTAESLGLALEPWQANVVRDQFRDTAAS